MGKTLIAAVVMFNFHRWFPTGRLAFLAPTKPLIHQQIKAVRVPVAPGLGLGLRSWLGSGGLGAKVR